MHQGGRAHPEIQSRLAGSERGAAQLVHAELIFRRGTLPDAEYTFRHALCTKKGSLYHVYLSTGSIGNFQTSR
jgi:hypothetical protein